jgi:hypothetical protein
MAQLREEFKLLYHVLSEVVDKIKTSRNQLFVVQLYEPTSARDIVHLPIKGV